MARKDIENTDEVLTDHDNSRGSDLASHRQARLKGEVRTYIAGVSEVFEIRTKATRNRHYLKMMPESWKQQLSETFLKDLEWRDNMPSFVLNLLQGRAMRLLAELSRRGPPCLQAFESTESLNTSAAQAMENDQSFGVPFLLWLGSTSETTHDPTTTLGSLQRFVQKQELILDSQDETCHFRLLRSPDGISALVFSLVDLLNASQIRWLRQQDPLFQQEAIMAFPKNESLEALSWVWRLALYVGAHRVAEEGEEVGSLNVTAG